MLNDTDLKVIEINYVQDIERKSQRGVLITNIVDRAPFGFKFQCFHSF